MSINPSGMDETDYSDFEYQQTDFKVQIDEDDTTGSPVVIRAKQQVDPLAGIGGLDNNEVAELVYMEAQVSVAHSQSENDQNVGSETRFNGVVGANLPSSEDPFAEQQAALDQDVISTANVDADGVESQGGNLAEDRIFAPFRIIKQPAFDDQTNGPGGAGGSETLQVERPWRTLTGRGPVLDSSDSVTALMTLAQEDEIIDAIGEVYCHMVWDVAETSDAGRAFSVPMD